MKKIKQKMVIKKNHKINSITYEEKEEDDDEKEDNKKADYKIIKLITTKKLIKL